MIEKQRKTNIVLLTDCLGDISGGAEKQIFELAKRLPKEQYNVFIASMEAQGKTSRPLIESIGCQLRVFRVIRIHGLSGLIQGLKFFFFLRKNKIDALMTYHFGSDIWGAFWGHLAGIRLIISNRRDMAFWRKKSQLKAYRALNSWVNKIITVSSSIKEMVMETEGVAAGKINVIYNGVEFPANAVDKLSIRAELGLLPQDTVIMHLANIRPVKGHRYLIEAFSQVAPFFPDAKLVLVGKDELNGELQKLARNLQVEERILFLGQRSDAAKLLACADIGVLPSLSEGMSNAILEYMAFGLPVIATRVGGNPELVHDGRNGLLVEKENTPQLAEALRQLLGDEDKCRILGENGKTLIREKFSMPAMLESYQNIFKMRVLHLISSAGLFGAERMVLTLASCKSGIDCWVGALNNHHNPHLEIIQEAKNAGVKTIVFDSSAQIDLRTIFSIKSFLKRNSIDIVHTHNYKSDILGFWATRFSRTRWVATNHTWHSMDRKMRFYEAIDAFVLKFAEKVFTVSQEIKEQMRCRGFKEDAIEVIHNGISVEQFNQKARQRSRRKVWQVSDDDILLAIVGRLSPEKGHKILFKALSEVVARHPSVKCVVVGDGPLKNILEQTAEESNLSGHIIFAGICKDMPDVYAACDILVNASSIEGLPMTLLEAMASGLPIVATPVGAVPQVIRHGENGLLFEPHDARGLAKTLLLLIKDAQMRGELAQEAQRDVSSFFNHEIMADRYKQFYKMVHP